MGTPADGSDVLHYWLAKAESDHAWIQSPNFAFSLKLQCHGDAVTYYLKETGSIFIASSQNAEQKLTALCETYSQHLVTKTSTLTDPLERQFEASVFSLSLKELMGLQTEKDPELERATSKFFSMKERSVKKLDGAAYRAANAAIYMVKAIDSTIDAGSPQHQREQTSEVSKNFLQEL